MSPKLKGLGASIGRFGGKHRYRFVNTKSRRVRKVTAQMCLCLIFKTTKS